MYYNTLFNCSPVLGLVPFLFDDMSCFNPAQFFGGGDMYSLSKLFQ